MELIMYAVIIVVLIGVGSYAMKLGQENYEDKLYKKFKERLEDEGRI